VQRDGTGNPAPGAELAEAVWVRDGPAWLVGGSMLVLRRIRMDLETWDDFGRDGKEMAVARRLDTGAPVTGGTEFDEVDTRMVDERGFPVVAANAHVVMATDRTPAERMLRRGYSYDDGPTPDGIPDSGQLFAAYQADAATAFVPVQARLAESDVMNLWITHVRSAAFIVPAGCVEGEFVGQGLLGT
jgi:dye decolorizing peroxidase